MPSDREQRDGAWWTIRRVIARRLDALTLAKSTTVLEAEADRLARDIEHALAQADAGEGEKKQMTDDDRRQMAAVDRAERLHAGKPVERALLPVHGVAPRDLEVPGVVGPRVPVVRLRRARVGLIGIAFIDALDDEPRRQVGAIDDALPGPGHGPEDNAREGRGGGGDGGE